MRKFGKGKKLMAVVLAFSVFAITNVGCFGKFELTRKIYGWNKGISGNWFVRTVVMWVLFIIPVYEIGGVLDLLIFNLIECLTGSNVLARLDDNSVMIANGENQAVITRTDKGLSIDFYEDDAFTGTAGVSMDGKGVVRAEANVGEENTFTATYQNGTMTIVEKGGKEIMPAALVEARVESAGFGVPSM